MTLAITLFIITVIAIIAAYKLDAWAWSKWGSNMLVIPCIVMVLLTIGSFTRVIAQNERTKQVQSCSGPIKYLRRYNTHTGTGGYLVLGTGSLQSETIATFMWKTGSGFYQVSEVKLTKIRFVITNTTTPYVVFQITNYCPDGKQLCSNGFEDFDYAVIYCREEDLPQDIKL